MFIFVRYTLYRISFNSLSSGKFCMKIQNCLNSVFNDFIHRDILVLVIEPVIVVNNLRLVAKFYFGNWSLCRKTVSTLSTNYLIDLIATTNFFSQMAITFTFANGNYFFSFHSLHCTAWESCIFIVFLLLLFLKVSWCKWKEGGRFACKRGKFTTKPPQLPPLLPPLIEKLQKIGDKTDRH